MHVQVTKQDYSTQKEFYYLFCSDLHFGAKGQDVKALERDFNKAKELNARIYINGDLFDMILHQDRKRYTVGSDKYNSDNNINLAINEAYDFLEPYANQIEMIGCGNHETSVQKYHNIDVIQQTVWSMNKAFKTDIKHGQFCGYIILKYHWADSGQVRTRKIFYTHGSGGSSEVTKGIINVNRHMYNKTCDIFWQGHTHTKLVLPSEWVLDVNRNDEIIKKERAAIITGAYSEIFSQYDAMKEGYILNFGEEKMRSLQSTGGIFMKHTLTSSGEIYQEFIL